ncbi:hypothetical protein Tco_0937387 [Tanacetum coccineum]|uniref:Uncharacterized protein n=1 Tax=Tanacetum coccineum TaxID=301880 RepID=A0ABQ5DF75_9ASTR
MTSITAQQTKLDLELVPKENHLDIGKCNGRIPHGFSPREPKFGHSGRDFDPLPSKEDTVSFLRDLGHTGVINSLNDVVVDQMHQPWRTFKNIDYVELLWEDFTYQIDNKEFKKQDKMYYPRFTKVIIHHFLIQEKSLSWRNRIGMHTSKDDYLINTLRFVSRKEASQKYGVVLPECLTSPAMKESKAYKTYLGFATGAVPPKAARKFKKASPSKKDNVPIPEDEEPVKKGKRLKIAAKKSAYKPATGIVIREPAVETKSKRKEKEKVDVAHGKGIELLSDVALTEEAQIKEVRKKSLRDFHKTHPSGSGTVAEDPPSVAKITPPVTSEGTGDIPGVPDVTNDDSSESESESWGNDEDDSNEEHVSSDEGSEEENESDKQASDSEQEEESEDDDQEENKDDDDLELESNDETEGDEERDDTTDQFDDDADARLEEPTETATGIVQGEDAHVTISTVTRKTEVPVTSSSRSSDLTSKFLKFSNIPHTDAEIVSPQDVPVHHEVPRTQEPTLLSILVSIIPESSPIFTNIPQSSHTFTPTPILATPTPPSTIQATNPLSNLPDFSFVFRFNDRISALEKEVAELKKDPLHTQVTSLVDEHLDIRLGETIEEFMNFLSESFTARIKEQVKDQLPQILPQEVSNFAPLVIKKLFHETRDEVTLAKASSQLQSTYEAASTLTEFELKKILLDKMEKSKSYLTAPKHRECYDGLKKYYALDQDFFYSYDVYTLKCGRKDKDKDEDPFAGSDRGLKRRKTSKDFVQSEEPVFEVADSDMPQDQEGDMGDNEDEPRKETASRTSTPTDKSLKDFDELMSTPIDFSAFIMNECYKALSEKIDWENPEGSDYPFDLSKPLPLITRGKRQKVPFEFFINNDLKYLQGGISTMTYTTSTTKTKAAQYDLPGIEDMVPNIWSHVKVAYDKYALWGISHWREQRKSFYAFVRGMQSRGDVYSTKRILAVTHVSVMRKYGYGYLEEIVVQRADNNQLNNLSGDDVVDFAIALRMYTKSLVIQKRVEDLQLGVESYQKKISVTKPDTTRSDLRKRHPYTPYKDPQGFIYVDDFGRYRLRSDELYKFSDGTLSRLLSSLKDITKNIDMTYLPKRRWSTLEKKRAHFMIKDINNLLKERKMRRSLEKFIGGRLYETDLRLLQRTI